MHVTFLPPLGFKMQSVSFNNSSYKIIPRLVSISFNAPIWRKMKPLRYFYHFIQILNTLFSIFGLFGKSRKNIWKSRQSDQNYLTFRQMRNDRPFHYLLHFICKFANKMTMITIKREFQNAKRSSCGLAFSKSEICWVLSIYPSWDPFRSIQFFGKF